MINRWMNRLGAELVGLYTAWMVERDLHFEAPIPAGAKILAANHPTTSDPFYLLPLLREPVSILIAGHIFRQPLFGAYLRAAGHIPVEAGDGRTALAAGLERLKQGISLLIFPEGSPRGKRLAGHRNPGTGAVRLALLSGAPLVPIGVHVDPVKIRYSQRMAGGAPDVARWYPRGPYGITVGAPWRLSGNLEDRDKIRRLTAGLMARINQLMQAGGERRQSQSKLI